MCIWNKSLNTFTKTISTKCGVGVTFEKGEAIRSWTGLWRMRCISNVLKLGVSIWVWMYFFIG